jgi:hypothetical protein
MVTKGYSNPSLYRIRFKLWCWIELLVVVGVVNLSNIQWNKPKRGFFLARQLFVGIMSRIFGMYMSIENVLECVLE